MKIENEFIVAAAPDQVFETLLDFQRIGPCIPGASVGRPGEDGTHEAEIAVRLGPMRLTYRGTVRLRDADRDERRASLAADVREVRGQGSAKATMTMSVREENGGSRVASSTEVQLSGRAAQMGAGIVEDVAGRLVADMAANLEHMLDSAPAPPPPPTGGPGSGSPAVAAGEPVAQPAPPSADRTGGQAVAGPVAAPAPPAAPIGGFRLLMRALWYRLRHGRRRAWRETT